MGWLQSQGFNPTLQGSPDPELTCADYSGKQKRHTLKGQVVIVVLTLNANDH